MTIRLSDGLKTLLESHPAIAPTGRIKSFLFHPERKTLAPSCMLRVYKGDLASEIQAISWYLQTNAGIKVHLHQDCLKDWKPATFKWWFDIGDKHPDAEKMDIESNARKWPGCNVTHLIVVQDTMESIRASWAEFIEAALAGCHILVDLSSIRAAGKSTKTGIVSTGVFGLDEADEGFLSVYVWLAEYLRKPCVENLLVLFGGLCKVVARGGTHKNGIVTTSCNATASFIWQYLDFPLSSIPGGSKKAVRLDETILEDEALCERIVRAVNEESAFLEKITYQETPPSLNIQEAILSMKDGRRPTGNGFLRRELYHNVCVTGDTWVQTADGARQVKDLIGKPFIANNCGKQVASTPEGFWSNGIKPVFEVETKEGYKIQLTDNHQLYKGTRKCYGDPYKFTWTEVKDLNPGDKLQIHNHRISPRWEGEGNFEQGWLVGNLFGDGCLVKYDANGHTQAGRLIFHGSKKSMSEEALSKILKECRLWNPDNGRIYTPAIKERLQNNTPGRNHLYIDSVGLGQLAKESGLTIENKKNLSELTEKMSSEFYRGFIQGLFDADSCVCLGKKDGSGKSLQIVQTRKESLYTIQRMLLRLGVKSTIYHCPNDGVMKIRNEEYKQQPQWRLDITGDNISQYSALIGYSHSEKKEALEKLLASYRKQPYRDKFLSEVKSITYVGDKEVFDCTIHDDHFFDGNGFYAHNCVGLLLDHSASCLTSPFNIAQCATPEEIPAALCAMTRFMCELHTQWRQLAHNYKPELYLSLDKDRQVGVTVMGLASFLAAQGVSYKEHVKALEYTRLLNERGLKTFDAIAKFNEAFDSHLLNPVACNIAGFLYQAYQDAAKIAREYDLERAFGIEPNQRCYLDYTDLDGYTVTRQIDPPFSNPEGRESAVHGEQVINYHPLVETASEVGEEVHMRHHEEWQLMMESTGLAHASSFDLYEPMTLDKFKYFVAVSPLRSTYYQQTSRVNQAYLDKGNLCVIDDPDCVSCGS